MSATLQSHVPDSDPRHTTEPDHAPVDDTIVVLDFDGTITLEDSVDVLLERHADARWQEAEHEWQSGRIGSRACLERQVECLRAAPEALDATIDGLAVDGSVHDVVAICAARGFRLLIASDGFDRVVSRTLSRIGAPIPFIANALVHVGNGRWSLRPATPTDACRTGAANCKCRVATHHTVLIGDGRSDFCVAHRADLVLAKGRLATYCERERLPWVDIGSLADAAEFLAIHDVRSRSLVVEVVPDAPPTTEVNR